jgi:hypothetical protein
MQVTIIEVIEIMSGYGAARLMDIVALPRQKKLPKEESFGSHAVPQ